MRRLLPTLAAAVSAAALLTNLTVVLPAASGGAASIAIPELREWLSYLASDQLQGRAVFSEGFGLAGGYIADHLRAWGVKPAGDPGQYLQTVRVLGVKTTSHSSVTVTVGGQSKTFADGDGVTFPKNMGGKRTLTVDRVEFAGYGLDAPGAAHTDYRGKDVKGAAVVWLGASGPDGLDASPYRRALTGRSRYATEQLGAAAAIGPAGAAGAGRAGATGRAGGSDEPAAVDFTTAQRLDAPIAPNVVGSEPFFEFLFSEAPAKYADLKSR
ncbi:MAG: hypothetical protein JF610_07690, partial [Acidobacteria bacterium]|nr:hypothetical protein [Acidobacteriota bacterium]